MNILYPPSLSASPMDGPELPGRSRRGRGTTWETGDPHAFVVGTHQAELRALAVRERQARHLCAGQARSVRQSLRHRAGLLLITIGLALAGSPAPRHMAR